MNYTIPFSVDDKAQECVVELLDLSQQDVIAELHRGLHEPGIHTVEFDPSALDGGLEAGVYIVRMTIGERSEAYPLQYMP